MRDCLGCLLKVVRRLCSSTWENCKSALGLGFRGLGFRVYCLAHTLTVAEVTVAAALMGWRGDKCRRGHATNVLPIFHSGLPFPATP